MRTARLVFFGCATVFALVGAVTAVWISRANVADLFYFGPFPLWSAMDPAGFYLPDVILYFDSGPIRHDHHPGLTMTLMGALMAKAVYVVCSQFGNSEAYVEFWVRHRIALNGMLAGLANAMLLACCHPLFKVLRHVMDRSAAYVGCALFLTSIPVLLWMSRFAPEAWMLYCLLWSMQLSMRVLDGDGQTRTSAAMGVCTALAVLSKWLALPVVALNLYSLLSAPVRGARTRWTWLTVYALCAGGTAAVLLSKMSLAHLVPGLSRQMRGSLGFVATLSLAHQQPLLIHHALVFGSGALGLALMFSRREHARTKLGALLGALVLMVLVIVRRPQWHYFFGFYWLFPAAAAYGLTLWLARWTAWRQDVAAVAAGLLITVLCNAWAYPYLLSTYGRYYDAFEQRAALAHTHPAWMPAPWEFAWAGFESTRDPARVFPIYGQRLAATLESQRRQEDGTEQQHLMW